MKNPSPKCLSILLGLPLLVAIADRVWTQGPVSKYTTGGEYANYTIQEYFAGGMGTGAVSYRRASVNISKGGETMSTMGISGPYYNLSFEVSVTSPTVNGYAYGSGPIATDYVTLKKPENHNLSLTIDTSLLGPPFYKYNYGDVSFPFIELSWTRTGNDWYRWDGHQINEMGVLVEHRQGSGVRYFTLPSGNITMPTLPLPLLYSYMDGWLGTESTRVTVIQKGPLP